MKVICDLLSKINGRICITSDMWTLNLNFGYFVLTFHFIDNEWKLSKRVLNFCIVESHHTLEFIASIIYEKWVECNKHRKIFNIVLDNCLAIDATAHELKDKFVNVNSLFMSGKHFHLRCCAHILNLIVQDVLNIVEDIVDKKRDCIKCVRSSQQRSSVFYKHASQLCTAKNKLVLDVPTP